LDFASNTPSPSIIDTENDDDHKSKVKEKNKKSTVEKIVKSPSKKKIYHTKSNKIEKVPIIEKEIEQYKIGKGNANKYFENKEEFENNPIEPRESYSLRKRGPKSYKCNEQSNSKTKNPKVKIEIKVKQEMLPKDFTQSKPTKIMMDELEHMYKISNRDKNTSDLSEHEQTSNLSDISKSQKKSNITKGKKPKTNAKKDEIIGIEKEIHDNIEAKIEKVSPITAEHSNKSNKKMDNSESGHNLKKISRNGSCSPPNKREQIINNRIKAEIVQKSNSPIHESVVNGSDLDEELGGLKTPDRPVSCLTSSEVLNSDSNISQSNRKDKS